MTNALAITTEKAATVAEQVANVVPANSSSKAGATQKKVAPKGQNAAKRETPAAVPKKDAKAGKKAPKPVPAKEASTARPESKGATLAEIQKATGWQTHSVRGFLSTAAKKHGLKIESTKTEAGDRVYHVKK